ncbi:response regulator [Rubripirellula reticaptiva]|uniref:response regulator n=1 Tax=Rubripirellula reticaptiva TaxID=2528013 RepID=UPI001645D43A|nr:response regulator [Rubripirellula reticaptiva]
MIADDVRRSRETIGKWLRECGFECRLAQNGRLAWEMIKEQPPELLVTDLEMPELCGLELLEKIRQADDESIRKLPVLVMTSLHDGQTLKIIQKLGGDGLLQKPLDKQATFSVIRDIVSARYSLQQTMHPGDEKCIKDRGVISPTLRRLLNKVAENEQ